MQRVHRLLLAAAATLVVAATATAAPTPNSTAEINCTGTSNETETYDVFDERQNGTENVRVNLQNLVLLYAPAESLLAVSGLLDSSGLLDYEDGAPESEKPGVQQQKPTTTSQTVQEATSTEAAKPSSTVNSLEVASSTVNAKPSATSRDNNDRDTHRINPQNSKGHKFRITELIVPSFLRKKFYT